MRILSLILATTLAALFIWVALSITFWDMNWLTHFSEWPPFVRTCSVLIAVILMLLATDIFIHPHTDSD